VTKPPSEIEEIIKSVIQNQKNSSTVKPSDQVQKNVDKKKVCSRYDIGQMIGSGGCARVYETTQHPSGQQVAIKLIKRSDEGKQTFLDEISVLSQIDHPNILKKFQHFADQHSFYIVMEKTQWWFFV